MPNPVNPSSPSTNTPDPRECASSECASVPAAGCRYCYPCVSRLMYRMHLEGRELEVEWLYDRIEVSSDEVSND